MRKEFLIELTKLAEKDPKVILIYGDVGFRFIEGFKDKFPNQWLNSGAAEQAMMGLAVGMSIVGWKPYVYTMKNFILLRPLEQLRNDICYGNANVKLVGVAGSAAYKFLGFSHNLREGEEEAILSTLPNIKCYKPNDEEEVKKAMEESYKAKGPVYLAI